VDPDRARQRLEDERARIERELDAIGAQEPGEEPEDTGDQASELDQAAKDEAIREELERTLEAIERAEARLEDGSYGKSVVSGKAIPDGRLDAIPWADRLVEEEPGGRR
jgi:DnaK suppressor protein